MIYLASPYSHKELEIRQKRYDQVCKVASILMRKGFFIFSPISHTHPIALYGLSLGWDFWEKYDSEFLDFCEEIWILVIPGWKESTGVQEEIAIMEKAGKPIKYVDLDGEFVEVLKEEVKNDN